MRSRRSARWPALWLVALCAALYLPGLFALPPVDRDEPRYAQAARQMRATGDLTVPHLQTAVRLIKPVGIYWLQAAALRLAPEAWRGAIGLHRLPSALGALGAVLGTFWIGRRWFGGGVAWLGAALLAASALLVVEAHLATTDAVLLVCIVAAQGCLARLYTAARRARRGSAYRAAGFWLALAAGVLVKGPVAPLVAGLTVAGLMVGDLATARRLLAALRPWWGVPLALACVAPWVVAVAAREGSSTLLGGMAADILPKLTGAHESHGGPPGFYLLLSPATFWPGSLLLVFALAMAWRRRQRPAEHFLLAWLVPTWLVFECLPTKLPNYVLPVFPALALLAARAALTTPRKLRPSPRHRVIRALFAGWALLTLTAGMAPVVAAWWYGSLRLAAIAAPTAAIAAVVAIVCLRDCWQGRLSAAALTAGLGAVLAYAPLLQWTLPHIDALWPSRAAGAAIARAGGAHRPLASVGYGEPSLVFLTRTDIAFLDAEAAANFLADQPGALVLVANDQLPAFATATARHGLALRNLWSTGAANYTTGRPIELQLFERQVPPP